MHIPDSYGLGDHFFDNLAETYQQIKRFPRSGQSIYGNMRRTPVRNLAFHVFYYLDEVNEALVIAAIVPQASNPANWPRQ